VVAIVDDGIRLSHRALSALIWKNPREVPGNYVDDDGNGHVDDVHGWDVSDADPIVTPPDQRLNEYDHGTHLAGVVTRLARAAYGESAPSLIRIMPVKALADDADRTYVKDGYAGIRYATRAGADIVVCAWGVGHISPSESAILREAREGGVLVVASAGNFPEGRDQFPAADESVLAVAALDHEKRKAQRSNYGAFVDLSAPGTDILSAGTRSDTDHQRKDGSSPSAAMVAAAAAIVMVQHPSYSRDRVIACLKQSAEGIDGLNPRYVARLGAGALNMQAAVDCALLDNQRERQSQFRNPQGYLRFAGPSHRPAAWTIKPDGQFNGLRFKLRSVGRTTDPGVFRFFSEGPSGARLVASPMLTAFPESLFVAGTMAHVIFEPKGTETTSDWLLEYAADPIDFSRLYCKDTQPLNQEGILTDGSGLQPYASNSDCKWLISAPRGRVVHFTFSEFDTEARTDQLFFFDGAGTHADIMAIFSGPALPPELTTWRNQVLVWFVTNGDTEGQGWKAEYRFVDP
jgi:hypothetical protein